MEDSVDISSINFTDEQLIADLSKKEIKTTAKLIKEAKNNDAKAQATIGKLYLEKKIKDKAYAWYLKSAQQGNADAQCALAEGILDGEHFKVDNREKVAREWCQKAVDQGHANAHGVMGRVTDLTSNDYDASLTWYHQAVFLGAKNWKFAIDEWQDMGPRYKLTAAEIKKARSEVMKWFKKDKTPKQVARALEQENKALQDRLQRIENDIQDLIEEREAKEEENRYLQNELDDMYGHELEVQKLRERVKALEHKHRADLKKGKK